jgi:hypothetical protein
MKTNTSKFLKEENKKIHKEKQKETKCKVSLYAKYKISQWYVDSGCSKHMTRDQNKFLILRKEKKGKVIFGDDVSAKILGKRKVSLGNDITKVENVI